MLLPFSQQLNGKPTYFPEKIWSGLLNHDYELYSDYLHPDGRPERLKSEFFYKSFTPKIHTLREDTAGRWNEGKLIHMVIDSRKPTMYQFTPVLPCTGIQIVQIKWFYSKATKRYTIPLVLIDGKEIRGAALDQLAVNDGFESRKDFFAYFSKDWTGKIIHWTKFRY
jgi:hypothetical protein